MVGVVLFIIQSIFGNRITNFQQKLRHSIQDIDSLKLYLSRYFTFNHFLRSSGSLKITNLAMLRTNFCAF